MSKSRGNHISQILQIHGQTENYMSTFVMNQNIKF